jgi:hypothetical protein
MFFNGVADAADIRQHDDVKPREENVFTKRLAKSSFASDERVLLYHLLKDHWDFRGAAAPSNMLQGGSGTETFRNQIEEFDEIIDPNMRRAFLRLLDSRPELRKLFDLSCNDFRRTDSNVDEKGKARRSEVVCDRCLQAVFDEYVHMLKGDLSGTPDHSELIITIGRSLVTALNLRVANLSADRISVERDRFKSESLQST